MKSYMKLTIAILFSTTPLLGQATTYSFDELNRLKRADYPNGVYVEYSYDAGGNITSITSLDDRDGDNIADVNDAFPDDPTEWSDNDGDLIGDNADLDDDNDLIPDDYEIVNGLDSLDSADALLDKDGDNYTNLEEYLGGSDLNNIASLPPADAPIISPDLPSFHSRVAVSFFRERNDAPIYYTIDGSEPTSSSTLYAGAFLLPQTSTVKAVAIRSDGQVGSIASSDFEVLGQAVWSPAKTTTWQWQLQDVIDTSYDVAAYDIDLFDTPQATIDQLKTDGRKVICYFSAGSYEGWRDDAGLFPEEVKGNTLDGFENEKWLDIKNIEVLAPIMQARLDLALSKGCTAVEPDNVDSYDNNNGLGLTAADQLAYNLWLSNEANARGLAIGLKNDLDQIPTLVSFFDFAVNEQCFQYSECDALQPFIDSNRAVFGVEYQGDPDTFCPDANNRQLSWLSKDISLNAPSVFCAAYDEPGTDNDNDNVENSVDNCPNTSNPGQEDNGGIDTNVADGIGDACQCGDVNSDGKITNTDYVLIKTYLLGRYPSLNEDFCDISGDGRHPSFSSWHFTFKYLIIESASIK